MKNINERLQEMKDKIDDEKLYTQNGLGNEINFHVFDYDPKDEYIVRNYLNYLNKNANVLIFNVYDIIRDILKEKGFTEKVYEYEKKKGTKFVNSIITKTLGISTNNDLIAKTIVDKVNKEGKGKAIIVTGVGQCYGIVRGHTILNNLQRFITENPLILMYPGTYDGQSFRLFNILDNDNYYRAFQFVGRD